MIHEIIIGFLWVTLYCTFRHYPRQIGFNLGKNLTCFTSGFSGSIDSHFDALGIDSHLRRTGADGDSQIEALSCKEVENFRTFTANLIFANGFVLGTFQFFGIVLWWIVFSSRGKPMHEYICSGF